MSYRRSMHDEPDEEGDDRFAYEPPFEEAEPAIRLGGAFAILNAVSVMALIAIRQSVFVFGARSQVTPRDIASILIDVGLGVLLLTGIRKARGIVLVRAIGGLLVPLCFFFFSESISWQASGAASLDEALFAGAMFCALVGSPTMSRKVGAIALFALHMMSTFMLAFLARSIPVLGARLP